MLPEILEDAHIQRFTFWFGGALQEGTHYHNELYYRALTVDRDQRTRLYRLACTISDQGGVILVSLGDDQCSLWISLRNQFLSHQMMEGYRDKLPRPSL